MLRFKMKLKKAISGRRLTNSNWAPDTRASDGLPEAATRLRFSTEITPFDALRARITGRRALITEEQLGHKSDCGDPSALLLWEGQKFEFLRAVPARNA